MEERYPVYAEADLAIVSREASHEEIVEEAVGVLVDRLLAPKELKQP